MKVKFPTQIKQIKIEDKLFVLEVIRDLDEAIDLLCDSLTEDEKKDIFAEDLCPYYGILWPAAHALGLYLAEIKREIKGKNILELGAGLGFPSMVATHFGANVLATDFHPDVEEFFKRNCRHSIINCNYQRLNWRDNTQDISEFDIVMGSDILYESKHPSEVAKGLIRFVKKNGKIILSDPGRAYLQNFIHAMNNQGYKEELVPIKIDEKEIFVFLFSKIY